MNPICTEVKKDNSVKFSVVLPAGTLDAEPPMQPHARIFWDSRAEWSCHGDGIPTYPEYPVTP